MKVRVLGAGSWGTALAILLGRNGHDVDLACRNTEEATRITADRENKQFLPGHPLPNSVSIRNRCDSAPFEPDFMIVAVPAPTLTENLPFITPDRPIFLATKGFTGEVKSGILSDVIYGALPNATVGAIGGPNLAREVVEDVPTTTLCACPSEEAAHQVCAALSCDTFRAYFSEDLIGVEVAGALKNVLAIGAGMSDGLGYGDNTKGSLLARGLREMTILGTAMGGQMQTFFGIAGVGDLFATANSKLSRNYRLGFAIAAGKTVDQALAEIGQVAEGVPSAHRIPALAEMHGLELPLLGAITHILNGELDPREAVIKLMRRAPAKERILCPPPTSL